MGPTFRPGDLLYAVPYGPREIRCGDVVVFTAPDRGRTIVHRVVSVGPGGIGTKGDNNEKEDRCRLKSDHILGRVVYAQGRSRWRRVHGGVAGQWCAYKARWARRLKFAIFSHVVPPLRRMIPLETFRRAMNGKLPTRVIVIRRPGGTELQLLLGRAVLGRIPPGRKTWELWWPIRLFLAEKFLPSGENGGCKSG